MTIVVADFGLAGMMSIEQETNETNSNDPNNNGHKITNSNHLSSRPPAPTKRYPLLEIFFFAYSP